jgi:NCAIR mutase (PurE)-related protein
MNYATVDLERKARCGFPEVIFAPGKTCEWLIGIVQKLVDSGQDAMVTRLDDEQSRYLAEHFPKAQVDRLARTFWLKQSPVVPLCGRVAIITAGTSDLPVAQEAAVTARAIGATADVIVDVGVAGLHRLLNRLPEFASADAIVVVAGMDGALPSVVGGLVTCPVIAVPTSVGYGTSFDGVAALLTMLNACSANVVTVNIDAGFKAGYVAAIIAKQKTGGASPR